MPKTRRSGIKIMYNLILLLDHLVYIMLLAITCGSLGFIAAMGVNVMSIRDNFKIANPKVNDETIYANLELVNLADFVRQNGGLDKVISEDGNNLSGGAKQRLALAINLATNKDIYIFDEASSNIDIESESIIMQNIKKIAKDKIVIVISHRLANVVDAKEISYLANGKVMEQGTHHDLMKLNQGYAYLYNRQKQLEEGYLEVSYA